jgi:hypothetical protein
MAFCFFAILWKLSTIMKHNFIAQLDEHLPYRFETIREKALLKQLAEKDAIIQKMEIQLEAIRETIRKQYTIPELIINLFYLKNKRYVCQTKLPKLGWVCVILSHIYTSWRSL